MLHQVLADAAAQVGDDVDAERGQSAAGPMPERASERPANVAFLRADITSWAGMIGTRRAGAHAGDAGAVERNRSARSTEGKVILRSGRCLTPRSR